MSDLRPAPTLAPEVDPQVPEPDAIDTIFTPAPDGGPRGPVLEVAQAWGETLLSVQHFGETSGPVTAGEPRARGRLLGLLRRDRGAGTPSFFCPEEVLPEPERPLFRWEDGVPVLEARQGMDGWVETSTGRRTLPEVLGHRRAVAVALEPGDRVEVALAGGLRFLARQVPAASRVRGRTQPDRGFAASLGMTAFTGGLFAVVLATAPPPMASSVWELPDRFATVFMQQPEAARVPAPDGGREPRAEEKAKREEGKRGKRDGRMERARGEDLARRQADKEVAEASGLLGALQSSGELDGVFGMSGLSADLLGGIGGLIGAKGVAFGTGLGSRGSGLGGGGSAGGLGGLRTRRGGGDGGGDPYGLESARWGKKRPGDVVGDGPMSIVGPSIDRALVDAVVRRHLPALRYCYQRMLNRRPDLSGKVTIRFTIAGDGTVSSSAVKSTTLGDAEVERCLTDRFFRMEFPPPKGGGVVIVSYPFMFLPG